MGLEQEDIDEEWTSDRASFVRNWIKRTHPNLGNEDVIAMAKTFEVHERVFNPYSDPNRFRLEAFRRIPGVVNKSRHILRTGARKDYYIDCDPLMNDPVECRNMIDWYASSIKQILQKHRIDVLGFIEKDRDSGGTTGAIRLAGVLSTELGIPNLAIRLGKELIEERIKFRTDTQGSIRDSLGGLDFALISDHSTTGDEAFRCVEAVNYRGGKVTDFIVYSLSKPEFQFNKFSEHGIEVHNFLIAPDDIRALGIKVQHEEPISQDN